MMLKRHPVMLGGVLVALATLLICGGIVVFNLRAFQVRYHRWQMQRAWHQAYSAPTTTDDGFVVAHVDGEADERYEYHRQKLLELRDIVKRHYSFRHLRVPTDASEHFSRLLVSGRCPNHIDFSSPYPDQPEPMQLTVWCSPTDAHAWDDFVAEHDIPDYFKRFMGTRKGGGEKQAVGGTLRRYP